MSASANHSNSNHSNKEFDIIVYGASGFTGRLVAEYLDQTYGNGKDVTWAMAGRNADKLAAVRDEIGAPADTPLIAADSTDRAAMDEMAKRAKVVATLVGPYQLYGKELLAACVDAGTDYVDLCGEVNFMHDMIAEHETRAKETGARIVFSCGFDSIPFDLGVHHLQSNAKSKFGHALTNVKTRVRKMQGTFSGGTAASGAASFAAAKADPSVFGVLMNPFSLTSGFQGAEQPADSAVIYDEELKTWCAPFIMAQINSKNIHRTNLLSGHAYGKDFTYNEMFAGGDGDQGKAIADMVGASTGFGDNPPKPGEGPSKEEREAGHYDLLVHGSNAAGESMQVVVTGDKDPGYGSTCKMITEAALCLIHEAADTKGGIWTSAPAMGDPLIERLRAKAGLTFDVVA